jgi:hypothetical protein
VSGETRELLARVSSSGQGVFQGKVTLNYLADVDPWLVHLTFEVAGTTYSMDVERHALMYCVTHMAMGGQQIGTNGAPLQIGRIGSQVRFHCTDTETGTWTNFDVDWNEARSFCVKTTELCSTVAEGIAMTNYVNQSLENFPDD